MTQGGSYHGQVGNLHGQADALPFSTSEWDEMRNEDKHAASVIVLLMMAIFILGVSLYLSISFWVMSSWRYG